MSSKDNPCRKFQANIFNKSKCQNCFKPRESHLLNDEDLNQAKPIYGGWLLLAPEGTNFDNPGHRSRKWQRRFFILYEHGLLRYALDEMPSTLPQGTINMNQCSDVVDGEAKTGQRNSLCILTPDKEHFIRAENKETINGWQENLVVYPRTTKQNLKKKRKVEPPTPQTAEEYDSFLEASLITQPSTWSSALTPGTTPTGIHLPPPLQEPAPAKVTVTGGGGEGGGGNPCHSRGIAPAEKVPSSRSTLWQEERRGRGVIPCSRSAPCLDQLAHATHPHSSASSTSVRDASKHSLNGGRKKRVESGYFSLEKAKPDSQPPQRPQQLPLPSPSDPEGSHRRSQVIERFETLEGENVEHMEIGSPSDPSSSSSSTGTTRQGRIERRCNSKKSESLDAATEHSMPDVSRSSLSGYRRAKSLDRRATESSMTPDLLNFKKGWMTKLHEDGLWKKHWFVLTDQSLRYYRDSIAEEAADLDGEIDLSTCYDVTEFPVQRNYGFKIHTKEGAFALCAMTTGIRRNWIQAIMKNVRPAIAPDVTRSLPEEKAKMRTALGVCHQAPTELCEGSEQPVLEGTVETGSSCSSEQRKSRIRDRRREGRYKTFDWAEFQHGSAQEKEEPDGQLENAADTAGDVSNTSSSTLSPLSSVSSSSVAPLRDPAVEELERERARRREERRRRFQMQSVTTPTNTQPITAAPAIGGGARAGEDWDKGTTEADCAPSLAESSGEYSGEKDKDTHVQVEIEQRWLQVETMPLREEKQVPISHPPDPPADRPTPQELAVLLGKELEQTQLELSKLQEENSLLQEQLQEAQAREQSAREGYVLQSDTPPSSSSSEQTGSWQQLQKLNQDLQQELEAQRHLQDITNQQVQVLKKDFSSAQDVILHHEAEIQALQAKLSDAKAEILTREQAVGRVCSDMMSEQKSFQEHHGEWERNEQTLRAQLKDSEDRLKDVEAQLLERSQSLRDLERQQALQRDHLKEVQKLQERLNDISARLVANEQAQALKEEQLQISAEKERQSLVESLAEAEVMKRELEDRLQKAEERVEELLREKSAPAMESSESEHQLEEQLAAKMDDIQKLTGTVEQLQAEKEQLTCRCQELLNQITEADNEVDKLQSRLKAEETDCYSLERSYQKVCEELQRTSRVLWEKDEEIQQTKAMYESLVEKKEKDLNEALVKMAALGSSLEETELKLRAKEELVCKGVKEPCDAEKDLQAKLEVAENRITELEHHLSNLQLAYANLQREYYKAQEDNNFVKSKGGECVSVGEELEFSLTDAIPLEGMEKLRTSSEISRDHSLSEENGSVDPSYQCVASGANDAEKFITVIHELESKLYSTEEKLKVINLKLEEQQSLKLEAMKEQHSQWTEVEAELRSQLNESLSRVHQLSAQLREERDKRCSFIEEKNCLIRVVNAKYEKALACLDLSREKVQTLLRSDKEGGTELLHHTLSEIETETESGAKHRCRNDSDITGGSLCMREAMIQAQIAYVTFKQRIDSERELKQRKEPCQGTEYLCKDHGRNVNTIREWCETSLQEECQNLAQVVSSLREENKTLREEVSNYVSALSRQQEQIEQMEEHFRSKVEKVKAKYELEMSQAEQTRTANELSLMEKTEDSQRKLEIVLLDIENMEDRHEGHMQKLEERFQEKIQELQQAHKEEMEQLHNHYNQTIHTMQQAMDRLKARHPEDLPDPEVDRLPSDPLGEPAAKMGGTSQVETDSMTVLRERIQELEMQVNSMEDELGNKHLEGDMSSLKEKYQKDLENLKATCERGFTAMEETHQKVIEEIQRQHQREVSHLLEERERLLAEETAATISAIEAMKNAHREELEKTQRSQLSGMSSDIEELRGQYKEDLQSIHRELEVLSEQYSQKCLENAHLAQALEAERQALTQCQRENQELNTHIQELNNRLTVEISRMRTCLSGEVAASSRTQGKDLYELEVLLRVKDSEIQYLKQEIHSLKDELQSALRDKKYTADKYKDIYTELSIVKAKADCDISKLKEQLMLATEALGEMSPDGPTTVQGYDILKSKSNPDFLKKEQSTLTRQIRGVRSKSLKEGLTVQERMMLFETVDSRET
ncbi:myosin-7B [Megalops cyprinoides]|uniref:myosin-7B n=1 Tax=Megalops cyprinoides TaxID=118141 RepID=UPI001863F781|nr:myosin-7B [Megalops cyprinoides]